MGPTWVDVPAQILVSTEYRPVAKVLYALILAHHLIKLETLAKQVSLEATSLKRHLRILRQADLITSPDPKYYRPRPLGEQKTVPINIRFLQSSNWSVSARLVYMVIKEQGAQQISGRELARRTLLGPKTLRKALAQLTDSRLIETVGDQQYLAKDPITAEARVSLLKRFQQSIEKNKPPRIPIISKGERLMKVWLDTVVVPLPYINNAATFEAFREYPLELDRLYISSPPVAFEFNGPYHYDETFHESEESFALRQALDEEKEQLCERCGIKLITVTTIDLTRERMEALTRPYLPLKKWVPTDQLEAITKESRSYINWATQQTWQRIWAQE